MHTNSNVFNYQKKYTSFYKLNQGESFKVVFRYLNQNSIANLFIFTQKETFF